MSGNDNKSGSNSGLVRAFSDDLKKKEPGSALSQSLAVKTDADRARQDRVTILHDQWNLLFIDAGRLMYACSVSNDFFDSLLMSDPARLHMRSKHYSSRAVGWLRVGRSS